MSLPIWIQTDSHWWFLESYFWTSADENNMQNDPACKEFKYIYTYQIFAEKNIKIVFLM